MKESLEYSLLGGLVAIIVLLFKIAYKNGIFCYTPCGKSHSCMLSTNKDDRDLIAAIRCAQGEIQLKQEKSMKDLENIVFDNLSKNIPKDTLKNIKIIIED